MPNCILSSPKVGESVPCRLGSFNPPQKLLQVAVEGFCQPPGERVVGFPTDVPEFRGAERMSQAVSRTVLDELLRSSSVPKASTSARERRNLPTLHRFRCYPFCPGSGLCRRLGSYPRRRSTSEVGCVAIDRESLGALRCDDLLRMPPWAEVVPRPPTNIENPWIS